MIYTNLENLSNEISEVVNQFGIDLDLKLTARFDGENKMMVFTEFSGKEFKFEYKLTYDGPLEKKRVIKRFIKLSAYKTMTECFGEKLPWGALTGIRPTKLAYQQGERWQKFFLDVMDVSPEKTNLIAEILSSQKPYYSPMGSVSDLFVSIPFCPSRCAYCSFLSSEISKLKRLDEYVDALIFEIESAKKLPLKYKCVYVGGGTPVSLPDEYFDRIMNALSGDYREFTVEAGRPDCITKEKLDIMKRYGVTRVCVNPQTFLDKTLQLIGRRHSAADVIEKYQLVKSYGFDVNMDLIAGLPNESFEDFCYSLDKAAQLDPENITVHTLCLKKGSKLKENSARLDAGDVAKMVDYAHNKLKLSGYLPYYLYRQKYMAGNLENTGYTKNGKACVYNIDIMEEYADIVACGANGVSKKVYGGEDRIERFASPKDVDTYLSKVEQIIEQKNKVFG